MAQAAPIVVTATLGAEDFAWLNALRRNYYPAARNHVPAHLTLFQHLPPSIAPELARRLAEIAAGAAPVARLDHVMLLDNGVAFTVRSPALETIRADLAEAFAALLVPQDQASWRPHVTIQNKVEASVARKLFDTLAATFAPGPLAVAGLASHYYRDGSWEPIASYGFRGVTRSARSPRS